MGLTQARIAETEYPLRFAESSHLWRWYRMDSTIASQSFHYFVAQYEKRYRCRS